MAQQSEPRISSLRLPKDLYDELRAWAAGNKRRPKVSMTAAIVFLLREGLRVQREQERGPEASPGNMKPTRAALYA